MRRNYPINDLILKIRRNRSKDAQKKCTDSKMNVNNTKHVWKHKKTTVYFCRFGAFNFARGHNAYCWK